MSGNCDEEKNELIKSYPLDLASKLTTIKSDGKGQGPLIIPGQSLRGMRLLAQTTPVGCAAGSTGTGIIATNIVPQGALIKQVDTNRAQIASIISSTQALPQATGNVTIQRQGQITLAASIPVLGQSSSSGATYHVPRGPAVVANLSAPRNNVTTAIRAPLVVAQSTSQQSFVRPPRTTSPAQGMAWLSGSNNGSQIKGASAILSAPVRGTTITSIGSKPQIVAARPQVVSTIRPTTTILHSAIIGQGQLHSFKSTQATSAIQALNTTITLAAQVLPNRTQTLVYSTGNSSHFTASPRITPVTTAQGQRQPITTSRPMTQVTGGRFTVPVNVNQGSTRLVTPTGTVLTSGARISTIPTTPTVLGASPARIISTTQANVSLGRLTVTVTNPSSTNTNPILTQIRSSLAMHPVVATTNTITQNRTLQPMHTHGTKVITQSSQGLQLTQLPSTIKTSNITSTTRTLNTQPTSIVTHRPGTLLSAQTIPLAKVFPHHGDGQQIVTPTNVFIQTPLVATPRRTSPGPTSLAQTTNSLPTTTVATYCIASGTYFYDTTGNYSVARSFSQPITTFAISQASNLQQTKPSNIVTQVHGVSNQPVRFNPIMVVEQSRNQMQQFNAQELNQENIQNMQASNKLNSSPRPSILRKRDHEGSPLKAAKNLIPALSNLQQLSQPPPISPPLRPDSRNNGHGSDGSTTISATSSPGSDHNEDSMLHIPMNKEEEENRPPPERSPRKKPRKQNFVGKLGNNDIDENNDDMQFITERDIKKDQDQDSDGMNSDGPQDGAPESRRITQVRKPASASLLNSYRQTWKTTHNHYLRHADVKPKDERRPSIMDLANQHRVLDKVNGWKIHHLSTQMEDLADQEENVHNQLTELLKYTESKEHSNTEFNRINELIKGNLQRIKIINDGMLEAKTQIMKIFDHKLHVADIINRCASKRNYKKREKS